MIDWFMSLFGKRTIDFVMITKDGRKQAGKVPYVGNREDIDPEDLRKHIIEQAWNRYRETVTVVEFETV